MEWDADLTQQMKIDTIYDLMISVSRCWDEDKVVNYPKELPSFDELPCLINQIEFKD